MWGFMDWRSGWTTSEFTNPNVSWEFHPSRYKEFTKNCHVFMIEAKCYRWIPFLTPALFKISTVKSCQGYYCQGYFCTVHIRKQTSFFLRTTVQRLYRPLPVPWNNFIWNTLKQFVEFFWRIVWVCLTILWGWCLNG